MESVEYGVGRYLDESYESALPRVVEALKAEGFGVITEIDVKKTMKEKLGRRRPPLHDPRRLQPDARARARSSVELDLGLLLPCNVVVYEDRQGDARDRRQRRRDARHGG